MAYIVNWTIATRPNTNVDFFELTETDRAHFQKYIDEGKLHSFQEIISPDGLSKTLKFIWYVSASQPSFMVHEMITEDAYLQGLSIRSLEYNAERGIQRSTMFFELRDDDGNILNSNDISNDQLFVKNSFLGLPGYQQN